MPNNTGMNQCRRPSGLLGQLVLRLMNARHSKVTDWGLSHISVDSRDIILDVGCGGGRTISKLAAIVTRGKVYGIDFSSASVAVAGKTNQPWIAAGRVEIREGSVSQLPFPDGMFNLVTAVETHFWWPDLPGDIREILRVLKPGGRLVIIAEVYKGADAAGSKLAEKYLPLSGMTLLSLNEHRRLLGDAGYSDIQIFDQRAKGWMCGIASKHAPA